MSLHIRTARQDDANAMADLLNAIIAIGGTTAHRDPFDAPGIVEGFIAHKRGISCFVAMEEAQLLGFQSLEWCDPDWPGDEPLPADWALVATYVAPQARGKGAGRALFTETVASARQAGVRFIDATIRLENTLGQAFYQGIGFTDYRTGPQTVSKRFMIDGPST